jgi:hypothetical protein
MSSIVSRKEWTQPRRSKSVYILHHALVEALDALLVLGSYLKKRQHRHQPPVDFMEYPSLLLRRDARQPFGILSGHTRLDLMRRRLGFLVDRDAVTVDVFDHCGVALGDGGLGSHLDQFFVFAAW